MRHNFFLLVLFNCLACSTSFAALTLRQSCINSLKIYKSYFKEEMLDKICSQSAQREECKSTDGAPIYHIDYTSSKPDAKKILVMSLIHGDEKQAGELVRYWLERLSSLNDARNSWRIIPIANPDGVKNDTRTNANGVDLNRNFPTADWGSDAVKFWEKDAKKAPRRFPGKSAGSEIEIKCYLGHLEVYKPDFVVSIHGPLHVLDFDGPKLKQKPKYEYLPWKTLGNYPGSLGRYLWVEKKIPVLTTELTNSLPATEKPFEQLQDLIGSLVKSEIKSSVNIK